MIFGRLALAAGGPAFGTKQPSRAQRPDVSPAAKSSPAELMATVFVWLVWAAMLAIALGSIYVYASRIPYLDDWNAVVPALTGEQPVTFAWLWSQHNEHRIFLPRLIVLGLLKLSGGDFRIGAYFNVALLAMISAGSIYAAQKVRGTVAFADALFPMLLLHLRHFENIFWIVQNQVIIPIGCSLYVLFVAASYRAETASRRLLICGIALLVMPFCGAYGLPVAFLSSFWLTYVAVLRCRRARADHWALGAILLAAATVTVCIVYMIGLNRAEPDHSSVASKFAVFIDLIGSSTGLSNSALNPISKTMLLFVPLAIGLLVWRWLRLPADRIRTAGVSTFFAGALAIIAAIASGRGPGVIPSRYFLLLVPVPVAAYIVFLLAEKDLTPLTGHRSLTTVLSAVVLLLGVTSIGSQWETSARFMENRLIFEQGMESQIPLPKLLAAYGTNLFLSREYLYHEILGLSKARMGAFRDYRTEAAYTVEPINLSPTTLQATYWNRAGKVQTVCPILWENGAAKIESGPNHIIQLVVPVGNPGPRSVRAIRLHYSLDTDDKLRGAVGFNLQWVRASDQKLCSETEFLDEGWHPRDKPLVLYIDDKIAVVSLFARGPFRSVTISGIDLCLPAGVVQ